MREKILKIWENKLYLTVDYLKGEMQESFTELEGQLTPKDGDFVNENCRERGICLLSSQCVSVDFCYHEYKDLQDFIYRKGGDFSYYTVLLRVMVGEKKTRTERERGYVISL